MLDHICVTQPTGPTGYETSTFEGRGGGKWGGRGEGGLLLLLLLISASAWARLTTPSSLLHPVLLLKTAASYCFCNRRCSLCWTADNGEGVEAAGGGWEWC
jgi:hypothetical protein